MPSFSSKKIIVSLAIVIVFMLAALVGWIMFGGGGAAGERVRAILPFGMGGEERGPQDVAPDFSGGGTVGGGAEQNHPLLRKLHAAPVAGASIFERRIPGTTTRETIVRLIERGVGHLYETTLTSFAEKRISNETRLKIYEGIWGGGGAAVAARYADEGSGVVRTYAMTLRDRPAGADTEGALVDITGVFLPENISSFAPSPDGSDRVAYVLPIANGSSEIVTSSFGGKRSARLFSSPLKEWLLSWPNRETLALASKPSEKVPGVLYFIDTRSGQPTKILGGAEGLTARVKPDGKKVLYATTRGGALSLFIYDIARGESAPLSPPTLPEKCVWGEREKDVVYCGVPRVPGAGLPDAWYQGVRSFSDDIWKFNLSTGAAELIASPEKLGGDELDLVEPLLGPSDSILVFINKKDSSLWSLDLARLRAE